MVNYYNKWLLTEVGGPNVTFPLIDVIVSCWQVVPAKGKKNICYYGHNSLTEDNG